MPALTEKWLTRVMGVIATIWVFISIASREKLVWESGPGLELGPGPRCLNPEVINGRIVIISDQLTISRDRDQEHISFLHGYNSHRNELSTDCRARSGEILL